MMSMNVREIFNIVKCCIVREISRRETVGREGVHTRLNQNQILTLRRRGYQYIIYFALVETFTNVAMTHLL